MHRFISVLSCCALSLTTNQLIGQVSLDMEAINAESHISAVTLYNGRASITRTTTLDLAAGGYSVFFNDLPSSTSLNSVQAHVSDDSALLGVDTIEIPVARNNIEILKEINAQIEKLEDTQDELRSKEEAIHLQKEMLQTLVQQSINAKEPVIDLEAMDAQLQYIGRVMTGIAFELRENTKELELLKDEINALKSRRNSIARDGRFQRNAVVDIGVMQSGAITIELTYLVSHANWSPVYAIRANTKGDSITIDYDAEISQSTGEDWTDVSITLSTAKPQQYAKPKMPSPWYVNVFEPIVVGANVTLDSPTAMRSRGTASFAWSNQNKADYAGVEMESIVEASKAAVVGGDGPVVNFRLPRTLVIPSNANEHQTTSIASIEIASELFRIAVPMRTEDVYIRSDVTNDSPYILLAGKASIFHGSDYVGKTTMSTVTPNETFPIDLGIDPSVTATRTLQEKNTSSTGLFASGKQTMYEYRIEISNGHDESIDLRVWDRIPVSQNEKIEISLKDLSKPLATNAKYIETKRPLGLLRWDLNVPANSTGEKKDSITWKVEVARGKDIEITPLPE